MIIPKPLRAAVWLGTLTLVPANLSCDALNPSFVAQLGGGAGVATPDPTGSIVLVFNNQTGRPLALDYDVEISFPGEATARQASGSLVAASGYWAATFDCNVSGLILDSISPLDNDGDAIELAVAPFRRPSLQCGSVIFVNMPLLGSPTIDLLP